jgi:predicted nucleic acid-binding protein
VARRAPGGLIATSFVLMAREKIRLAFAFDHHFASVGFRLVG